ncbi:hypothetical protein CF70_019530 [Cupriavidus sp. SK-3]|nr:hypothetical protein CF70_019530 [Cupriavidus sp. SK-3]
MLEHGIEQLFIRQVRVTKTKFSIGCTLLTQSATNGESRLRNHVLESLPARGIRDVFDDIRLDASVTNERKRVARSPTVGVVIDGYAHKFVPFVCCMVHA